MCLTACAQKKGGERGPRMGGGMSVNKDSDSAFVALKNETLKKFRQLTFEDAKTGKTMSYNLLVPEGAEAGQKLPLVLFMADASTAGKDVTAPLTQGYGALEFASNRDGNINFIKWEAGSVLPETGRAMEHMASFDYGYKIAAVRDWLFKQSK